MGLRRNVAIPQGTIYPNGVGVSHPNESVQATVHVPGSLFQESPGYESVRPARHRMGRGFRSGIHFTSHRYAEDVGQPGYPLVVDEDAAKHADVAELPGSERLDDEGKTTQEDRVFLADSAEGGTAESLQSQRSHDLDLDGVRTEARRWSRGLWLNPVDFLSDEVRKTPVKAVAIAGGIVSAVYVISRDFERAYRRRSRRAGLAGAPAAAVEGAGSSAATAVTTPVEVVKAVADNAGEAIEDATGAVAEATS